MILSMPCLIVFAIFAVASAMTAPDLARECKENLLSFLGTEKESIENVRRTIHSAACRHLDTSVLELMAHCKKLEVAIEIFDSVDFVAEKDSTDEALKELIKKVFLLGNRRIIEDSFEHKLVLFCVRMLLASGYTVAQDDMSCQEIMPSLVYDGNTELLKSFIAFGCRLPPVTDQCVAESRKPIEMLKLYVSNSLDGNTYDNVSALFQSRDFTSVDFEAMIKEGSLNSNQCMDVALSDGRLDLAYVGYMNGLRLPYSMEPDSLFHDNLYANTPTELAAYIATKESFRKTKSLLEAMYDTGSYFKNFPKEILLNYIGLILNSVTVESIRQDLFESNSIADSSSELGYTDFDSSDFSKKW